MENLIIIAILVVILTTVIRYLVKAKKRGVKCIGCPEGCTCGKQSGSTCGGNRGSGL